MDLKDKQNQDTITLAMLAMHAILAGRKCYLSPGEVAEISFNYAEAMQKEAKNRGLQ